MGFVFRQDENKYFMQKDGNLSATLPGGLYKIVMTPENLWFEKITPITDTLLDIPGSAHEVVVKDIAAFVTPEVRARYAKYGVVHKRGIILFGPAGTGKTVAAIKVSEALTAQGGIVLFNPPTRALTTVIPLLRENNPDTTIGIIYEEFEDVAQHEQSDLLPLLDGELQVNNMVIIACTNYISRIPERIKNRPSRFGLILEVGAPNAEFRTAFFKGKMPEEGEGTIQSYVDASDGFVVDHMKDLVISTKCLDMTLPDAVAKIKGMIESGAGIDDYNEQVRSDILSEIHGQKVKAMKFVPRTLI